MSDLAGYLALKKRVTQLQEEVSRAEGAYEQLLAQMEKEFGCRTIKSARKLLQSYRDEMKQLDHDISEAVPQFEEKWSDRVRQASEVDD